MNLKFKILLDYTYKALPCSKFISEMSNKKKKKKKTPTNDLDY